MKTNQTLRSKLNNGAVSLTALPLGIILCLTVAGSVLARDPGRGRGGAGAGVRPGHGAGGVAAGGVGAGARGVGVTPGVGLGAPGVGVLPKGYYRAVPAGYTTVTYRGYACRLVAGVYYRAATYEGETVWIVVT
jgi:hypothetical protein